MRSCVVLAWVLAVTSAFVVPTTRQLRSAPPTRLASVVDGADCVDDDSCSVEELQTLLAEVKEKAAEIKALEAKLTALNKDDSSTLKAMLAAEECELNGFDGCAAWYYDD